MDELLRLCNRLAAGTSRQQQRAWTLLVERSALWETCQRAVAHYPQGGSLSDLLESCRGCYEVLGQIEADQFAHDFCGGNAGEARRWLLAARRVAAAVAVAL